MTTIKTRPLTRQQIGDFIKSDRGVRAFEAVQDDIGSQNEAISTASFLVVGSEPALGSERTLVLSPGELDGSDGGANAAYTLGLANTAVSPASYGGALKTITVTIDAKGRITAASELALGSAAALIADTDATLAANSDARIATQKATKSYVDNAVTGLLDFKGATDCSGNPNYPAALKGDAYVVSIAGRIGGASGKPVDAGDLYLAIADNAGGAEAAVGTSWIVLEHNLQGALLAANNLSDVASAATARTNLGIPALAHGTYTPTLTNISNLDGSTAYVCQYQRVGDTVTVSGRIDVDPTAASASTVVDISLPITGTNFTADSQAGGAAAMGGVQQSARVAALVGGTVARLSFLSTDTANRPMNFCFMYWIV